MGELYVVPALVEGLVDALCEGIGVVEAVLAGGALAGDDGAHLAARAAGLQAALLEEIDDGLHVVERHALDLQRQARGEGHLAVAEAVGGVGDALQLRVVQLAVAGEHAAVEVVGALAVQEAQGLYRLDVVSGERAARGGFAVEGVDVLFQHVRAAQHSLQAAVLLGAVQGLEHVAVLRGERGFELAHQLGAVLLDAALHGGGGGGINEAERSQRTGERAARAAHAHAAAKGLHQLDVAFRKAQTVLLIGRQQQRFGAVAVRPVVFLGVVSKHKGYSPLVKCGKSRLAAADLLAQLRDRHAAQLDVGRIAQEALAALRLGDGAREIGVQLAAGVE